MKKRESARIGNVEGFEDLGAHEGVVDKCG